MQKEVKQDIREYKMSLRKKYKEIRKNMTPDDKYERDQKIYEKLITSKAYKDCSLVLTYVSTKIEVDTHQLIKYSLENSKIVAVPKCIAGTRNMKFYVIKSIDDLEVATFSVLEPKLDLCSELIEFDNAICIIPGLAFDVNGYRLGYGKGYYDRFLDKSPNVNKIGICYCSCTTNNLARGKFDIPVNIIITEKYSKVLGKKAVR